MRAKHKLGDCYESAGRQMLDAKEEEKKHLMLCHGIVTGRGDIAGMKIGHAWVELSEDLVIDKSNGNDIIMRREKYYLLGDITKVVKYTHQEALENMLKFRHFGPWDDSVTTDWQRRRYKSKLKKRSS